MILTTRNYKLDKSKGNDVATVGISLAPVTKGEYIRYSSVPF